MSYYTYFSGTIGFELNAAFLKELQNHIADSFNNKCNFVVTDNTLTVSDEWKDRGFMENVVLFIQNNGLLLSGKIECAGENTLDKWEIVIQDNKPFLKEIGSMTTLARTYSKLNLLEE